MAAGNLDGADLLAAIEGGLINEDVMQVITDISDFPLPFTQMIGSGSHSNPYFEWTKDKLADPDVDNAVVDGSDQDANDTRLGTREGNHSQTSVKQVQVSWRADATDNIGRAKETTYQLSRRTQEVRRDQEAIMLSQQGSQIDNGIAVPGLSASLEAWMVTNTFRGVGGSDGGFGATNPTIVDPPIQGASRGLTETLVRDAAQAAYEAGGNPSKLMAVPALIRRFSEYMFDDSARAGVQTTQTGKVEEASKAIGSVNVFITDFNSVLIFEPNRLQPVYPEDADVSTMFLIDPAGLKLSSLYGLHAEQMGKKGLSDNWLASHDWGLAVLDEAQHALIADLDSQTVVVP